MTCEKCSYADMDLDVCRNPEILEEHEACCFRMTTKLLGLELRHARVFHCTKTDREA